ncbi:MAG TPA: alkaline phosphatase family protein [Acidobacteriaceae bacterium]
MKRICAAALCLMVFPALHAKSEDSDGRIHHVLLISVDGMHAVDYLNCSKGISGVNDGSPYCPHLAALRNVGVNYVSASTSKPSDSFPGLMNIVTGATPRTMGVYYDVAYDRSLDAPAKTTGNGVAAGPCTANTPPTGTRTEYEEGIDIDQSKLNGGAPGAGLTDGGIASIDPDRLERDPSAGCAPVWPWNFVRTNTIFGVIHGAGGYTAWSDKHPAYSSVSGPGGGNVDDYYSPEINSTVIPLPGVSTPGGMSCATIPDPSSDLSAWTNSFQNIQCYDTLKVNAILNEIEGKTHSGNSAQVPTLFGMNFQAVSVGQKLIEKNVATGGYLNAIGAPTPSLLSEFQFVDASIGKMVDELKERDLFDSTLIIITAKHGQSPIDPNRFFPIPGHSGQNGESPADLIANLLPDSESPANPNGIGPTQDDVSLLWLTDSSTTDAAVTTLEENATKAGIGQIFYGPALALNYNKPGLGPGLDPRTPDIIVSPNVGVIYTGSTAKLAEHGGFAHDDTNVILLFANPKLSSATIHAAVETTQVAPTILKVLGLDPKSLDGVRLEGTSALPQVNLTRSHE